MEHLYYARTRRWTQSRRTAPSRVREHPPERCPERVLPVRATQSVPPPENPSVYYYFIPVCTTHLACKSDGGPSDLILGRAAGRGRGVAVGGEIVSLSGALVLVGAPVCPDGDLAVNGILDGSRLKIEQVEGE